MILTQNLPQKDRALSWVGNSVNLPCRHRDGTRLCLVFVILPDSYPSLYSHCKDLDSCLRKKATSRGGADQQFLKPIGSQSPLVMRSPKTGRKRHTLEAMTLWFQLVYYIILNFEGLFVCLLASSVD